MTRNAMFRKRCFWVCN